jgi:hypothetical protein
MALAWWMSASRALRGPLSGSCRPSSPRCAMDRPPSLQEPEFSILVSCRPPTPIDCASCLPSPSPWGRERELAAFRRGGVGGERVKKAVKGEREGRRRWRSLWRRKDRWMDFGGPLLDCSYFVCAKSFPLCDYNNLICWGVAERQRLRPRIAWLYIFNSLRLDI